MTGYFMGLSSLMSMLAALDMLFRMGSFYQNGEMMHIGFWPWLLCVAVLYGVNVLLMRRGCTLATPIALDVAGFVLMFAGGLFGWMQLQGITAILFAAVFYGSSVMGCFLTAKEKVSPNKTLVHVEMLILFFAGVLLLEGANFPLSPVNNIPMMLALGCNLVSLILARVVTENRVKVEGGRYQGILLLATVAVLFFVLALVGVLAFSQTGNALMHGLVGGLLTAIKAIIAAVGAFLNFLLSLMPVSLDSALPPPEAQAGMNMEYQTEEMADLSYLLPYVIGIFIVLLLAVLVWVLLRTRKLRLGTMQGRQTERGRTMVVRNRLLEKILEALDRLRQNFWFRWQCLCHRDSPQMVLLEAEHWGKQHKMPRLPGDAPGAYVRRVAARCFATQPERMQDVLEVCDCLDHMFYSTHTVACPKDAVKRTLRAFRSGDVPCNSDEVQV